MNDDERDELTESEREFNRWLKEEAERRRAKKMQEKPKPEKPARLAPRR